MPDAPYTCISNMARAMLALGPQFVSASFIR
jgi:hypothetical protein